MESTTDFSKGIDNATTSWRDALKALITPKLPTLADMKPEEREACKWMQCRSSSFGEEELLVIAVIHDEYSTLWHKSGVNVGVGNESITPLPDLPKLEWPGGVVDCEIVEEPEPVDAPPAEKAELPKPEDVPANELWLVEYNGLEFVAKRNREDSVNYPWRIDSVNGEGIDIARDSDITLIHKLVAEPPADQQSNSSETPKSSIKPEDVPANEPWLIEADGQKLVGARYQGDAHAPWAVAALDGSFAGDYGDNGITLIHKLVPETPALPEGMRLADHEEYGRVVVAPRANTHGEEFFYRLGEDSLWGASYGYRPTEEFTFLGGGQHV